MDSMLSGMKRAAAVLQTTAKGSGDLGMVIYHQKEVAESWSRLSAAKLDAAKAYTAWGKSEGETMMQFFEHQNQLDAIFINLVDEMVKKYDYNRRCYKEILKGEKTLEELMERKKECEMKVTKTTKQYEGSRKGTKQKNLEVELGKVKAMFEQANDDLDRHQKNHERFKFQKLAEAYKDHATIQMKFHDDCKKVAYAQAQLNQVYLQENFKHFSGQRLHALTVDAETVLNNLSENLNNSKTTPQRSQGSKRSNTSFDGEWNDFDDEYNDNPQQEIHDSPDMRQNANRPLPPVPTGEPAVYDNRQVQPGEYLEMEYAEYEEYDTPGDRPQQRSEQYLNVYEPLQKAPKEPAAKPLGDLMSEMKLEQQRKETNQGYLSMRGPSSGTESPTTARAVPNPYAPAPGRTNQQGGQLYPNVDPNNSPPDGADFLPPPPAELLNREDDYDNTGPHEYV